MSKTAHYNIRFQDINFNVKNAKGKKLEQLIVANQLEQEESGPASIFIKLEGLNWSEFYLDVCFGVWGDHETQKWSDIEISKEAYNYVDATDTFGLKDLIVRSASCKESSITVEFENDEKLIFKYRLEDEWEGDTELVKR
ncbi:MAG: hypothetical protein ACO1N0_10330 [Fluviicola sp.]